MKRYTIILVTILLILTVTAGCKAQTKSGKTSIVCTIFPQYDWVKQILGEYADSFDITLLSGNSIDLHNYQPSVSDIITISNCDLFIYVGGESDEWVDTALTQSTNKSMRIVNLLDLLGDNAKPEEIIEGMESEEEGESAEEEEYDEHVWLSLKNAQIFCSVIADALCEIDKVNATTYRHNQTAYLEKLHTLDTKYQQALSIVPTKTILVGDRFPFRYLVDDYGLSYYAAFVGCSAETEASFETIIFLARKVNEFKLKSIVVTESADQSIAKTIRDNTTDKNQQVYVLNAMQSIGETDIARGITYLSIMESNLEVLKEVLQ